MTEQSNFIVDENQNRVHKRVDLAKERCKYYRSESLIEIQNTKDEIVRNVLFAIEWVPVRFVRVKTSKASEF